MDKTPQADDFASQLLRQDEPLSEAQYREYRMKLDEALTRAERREKVMRVVVAASFVVSLTLMFVGGSKIAGSFDPWSKDATVLSVTLGVVYVSATAVFFLSLASYYSRFRPGVREAGERLRDARIVDLEREIRELRKQLEGAKTNEPGREKPGAQ